MLRINLPSLRYSNFFRFLVIIDMIILITLWIIGSSIDEKSELDQIIKFHFTESIFDIIFLSSFKALILFILISEIESACYKIAVDSANQVKKYQSVDIQSSTNADDTETLIESQDHLNNNSTKRYLQNFTLIFSLASLVYILVKFGFVTNLLVKSNKEIKELPMSYYFYAILITELVLCLVEFVLSTLNWKFMRNMAKFIFSKALENETDTKVDKKNVNIKRLISLSYPERYFIFTAFIMLIISSFTNIVSPYFFGSVVDSAVNYSDLSQMNKYIFYLLGIYLLGSLASGIRSWLFEVAGQRVVARLRQQVFNTIIKSDITFFDTSRTGELTSRISSDTQVLQSAVTTNISMFARYFLQIIGSIIFMFTLEPSLSGLLIGVIPIVSLLTVQYGRYLKKLKKEFQDELAASSVIAEETISSMRTVRSFAAEGKMSKEYEINIGKSFNIGKKLAVAQGGFMGFVGMISGCALALVLWYGGKLVHDKKISTGILASFLMYTLQVAMAFAFLSSVYGDFMQALGASQRIFELLDRNPLIKLNDGIVPADEDSFDGSIEFQNVDFSYPTRLQTKVLNDVTLKIEKGKTIALVGPSGGGKSTIFALIERFYDPLSGSITLGPNNFDLKSINTNWLHSKIALVSQEPVLFGGTVKENISFGIDVETDLEKIIEVSKLANAHEFIINFEKGYDTVVGERGIRLSGGQKQRIAIARALLVNPKLLLLDEATSALDSESENLVQEAIERAMKDRTVCVIAHRLSTVRNADRVIVLDNGHIVEQGTHDELCSIDGIYKRLVLKQLLSQEKNLVDS